VYSPYNRDGPMRYDGNYGADPDYGKQFSHYIAYITLTGS
jgi:hypothetical protein